MVRRILLISILLGSVVAGAEQPMCVYKADDMGNLSSVSQSICEQTQKSPECQELYKTMSPEDLLHKSLECTNQEDRSTSYEMYKEYRDGCNQGGWNFVTNVANGIGDSLAQIRDLGKEEVACNANLEMKRAIFADYNISVPEILRLTTPSEADIQALPCNRLKAKLQESMEQKNREVMIQVQRKREKNLTPQEQDFVDFRNKKRETSGSLIDAAKKKLDELHVKYQCYNTRTAAEMICEAAAEVGTMLGGPARLAFQAAKSERILKLAGLGRGVASAGKVETATANLARVSALSNADRIAEAEKVLGRSLTQAQKDALIKAHEVGAGTGRGFTVNAAGELESSTYSALDLREKAKILQDAGFSAEQRQTLMRRGIAGSVADVQKLKTQANDLRLAAQKSELPEPVKAESNKNPELLNKVSFPKKEVNTEAFKKTAKAYDDYLAAAGRNASDSDYGTAAMMNMRGENYSKAAEYYVRSKGAVKSSQRTDYVIEDLVRERNEYYEIMRSRPNNAKVKKQYEDHRKMMEAVTNLPDFPLSPAAKSQLLK